MHPTIDLDFVQVPGYTAIVGLGAVTGLVTAYFYLRNFSRRVYSLTVFLDSVIVAFAAGLVGARLYYIAMHLDYYAARSDQITQLDAGGLGIRGALITGAVGLVIYARLRNISFGRLADAAALGLTIGQAIGWIGALTWGANYGAVSDSAIAVDLPNIYGLVEPRYPLQYAEIALYSILVLVLVYFSLQCPEKGHVFLVYLLVASSVNFVFGFFRGDESAFVGAFRVDQLFDAAFASSALIGFAFKKISRNPSQTVNAK